jgi:hypothetical protein
VPEQAAGFYYKESIGDWESTKFNAESETFLITPVDKESVSEYFKKYEYKLKFLGEKLATAYCDNTIDMTLLPAVLYCAGKGEEYRFNKKSLRFIKINYVGYYNVLKDGIGVPKTDKESNEPNMVIEKCPPI